MASIATAPQAAEACSIARGVDPAEVSEAYAKERRKDTIRVRGELYIKPTSNEGAVNTQDEDDSIFNAEGVLVSRNGKKTYKVYVYDVGTIQCWGPRYPHENAQGTFYIKREKSTDLHRIIDWEGTYLSNEEEKIEGD